MRQARGRRRWFRRILAYYRFPATGIIGRPSFAAANDPRDSGGQRSAIFGSSVSVAKSAAASARSASVIWVFAFDATRSARNGEFGEAATGEDVPEAIAEFRSGSGAVTTAGSSDCLVTFSPVAD